MKEIFSYTKLFTILLAIFYISGLFAYFYHVEILFSFLVFLILILLIYFLNLDFKKALILYFIFFAGFLRARDSNNLNTFLDGLNLNNIKITGQIISSKTISEKNNKIKFYSRVDSAKFYDKKEENLNTKILISLDNLENISKKIEIGDYIEVEGKLRTPKPSSNPYQFDYQKYLLNNDVKNILYADLDSFKIIKKVTFSKNLSDNWYFVLNKFEKIRNGIIEKHSKNIKSPRLEVLGGIVFGNETINPSDEIKENFKNSGLLHLLAASGLNVALIYGIWWWIANLFRFPYNLSILFGAMFVVFYTFMTGFPPSILRASIMLLFVLFGKLIDREANSLALIFFVGFLMLLCSPKMIFDVGFQLSFVVTIGLVVCTPVVLEKFDKLDKKFREKHKKISRFKKYFLFIFSPKNIASIIAIPLIAQLWVIPLQLHYFNNFAPFSLLANIAVVPFIGILSFIGFLSSIVALIPKLNVLMVQMFDFVANPLLGLLICISEFFSSFKISLISTCGLSVFQIFLLWGIILTLTLNLKYSFKNKKQIVCLGVMVLIFLSSLIKLDCFKNNLEIMMFDVENADCFLIKTPKNKYIMIDTGKRSYQGLSSAQMIINKYLKNERINKLEKLIVTHFDSDHSAGVIEILENTKTKEILIQKEEINSQISNEILNFLKNGKFNYKIAKNNEEIYKEKDLKVKTFKSNNKDDNEGSIVTLLSYKDKNILFMGDAGKVAYKEIDKNLPNKINILKVGHHGAKNSLDNIMVSKIKPDYALISTGLNKFNHPHYETVNVLEENNVKIISTKNYGFVKIMLKDDTLNFLHFDKDSKKFLSINFDKKEEIPFHKSKFTQDLINKSLQAIVQRS